MKQPSDIRPIEQGAAGAGGLPAATVKRLGWSVAGLVLCFGWPLYALTLFSIGHDLYSHILLIPLVSGYLVWQERGSFSGGSAPARPVAMLLLAAGIALTAVYVGLLVAGPTLEPASSLALSTVAFVTLLAGICAFVLGRDDFRVCAFPLGFLAFMIPIPEFGLEGIETFLQYGSAWVATAFFSILGTPLFREGLVLQLPGINLQVAPECSGIHSSYALVITSVLAGRFFLRSAAGRAVLALAVIPLALLRNGFRIFTIGELCVHISPDMINSYIHHHGGPIFFALALVPFFLLLVALIKVRAQVARRHERAWRELTKKPNWKVSGPSGRVLRPSSREPDRRRPANHFARIVPA